MTRCHEFDCSGCMGMQLLCGHSFACVEDPAYTSHRCSASSVDIWWSLFLTVATFVVVVGWRMGWFS